MRLQFFPVAGRQRQTVAIVDTALRNLAHDVLETWIVLVAPDSVGLRDQRAFAHGGSAAQHLHVRGLGGNRQRQRRKDGSTFDVEFTTFLLSSTDGQPTGTALITVDGSGRIASDGSEHFGSFRMVALDPLEQTYTREVHLEKWSNGELVAQEEYILRGNMYLMQEMLLMLKVAGFRDITVHGDYTDHPATADDAELVFVAVK